jgi:hypothetical protein
MPTKKPKPKSYVYRLGSQEIPITHSSIMRGPKGPLLDKAKQFLVRASKRKPLPPDPDEFEPVAKPKTARAPARPSMTGRLMDRADDEDDE